MAGNVLRYEVEKQRSALFMLDYLHHRGEMFEQGARVQILVPKKECIML